MSLEHSPAKHISGRAPAAQSIKSFCRDVGISPATYYNLRRRGCGPDELRFEGSQLVLITAEAAQRWRKKFTQKGVARPRQRAAAA